jgi:hypothetical protein
MVAEVCLGKVGPVAAREVLRFARNSNDWQQPISHVGGPLSIINSTLAVERGIMRAQRCDELWVRSILGPCGSDARLRARLQIVEDYIEKCNCDVVFPGGGQAGIRCGGGVVHSPGSSSPSSRLVNLVGNRIFSISAFLKAIAFALLLAIGHACSQTQGGATGTSRQASTLSQAAAGGQPPPGGLVAPGAASVTVVQGHIVSVDQENKLVMLQAAGGKQVILHVFNQYSLAAAKPGEPFIARFYEIASVQKLGPGQSPSAQSLTAGIVNAAPDQTPGAPFGRQYQFAVTIDAIDKNGKTISIKGLDGAVEVVVVANPESLDQLHVGEQIVVTLIDVVAIALDKEGDSA